MKEIELRFSRPMALFVLLFGVPFFLTTISFLCLGLVVITLKAHEREVSELVLFYIGGPAIIAFASIFLWAIVRYRESLFTEFRFSQDGICIQSSRYGMLRMRWDDIEQACFSQTFKLVRLHSPKLLGTLAVMNTGTSELSEEFQAAVSLMKQELRSRWRERWL
jgi:hypothetical protein